MKTTAHILLRPLRNYPISLVEINEPSSKSYTMSFHRLEDRAPAQPTSTEPFPTITPTTTASTTRDEKVRPINIELKRTSSVSPPATAHPGTTPYDTDIEAMTTQQSADRLHRQSMANLDSNCSQWPGQDHWKRRAKAAKMSNRSCQCFARLSRRARIAAKIAIILLIVGIAVGVGFGVSKPLGAGIWQPNGR